MKGSATLPNTSLGHSLITWMNISESAVWQWTTNEFNAVWCCYNTVQYYTDGLMQERRNSIANTLELRLSCTSPSIYRTTMTEAEHQSDFGLKKAMPYFTLTCELWGVLWVFWRKVTVTTALHCTLYHIMMAVLVIAWLLISLTSLQSSDVDYSGFVFESILGGVAALNHWWTVLWS